MYEARQNKEKVSRQIQVGERYGIQLRGSQMIPISKYILNRKQKRAAQ